MVRKLGAARGQMYAAACRSCPTSARHHRDDIFAIVGLMALGTVPSESLSGCSGGAVSVLAASPSTLGETNMTTEYAYLAAVSTTPAVCFGLLFGIDIIISSNSDCTKKLLDVDWIPKILSDILTYFFFFSSYSIYLHTRHFIPRSAVS